MRYKRPDTKNAESIVLAAERDMVFTLSLTITPLSSATVIRNIYECFRMLGDALLIARGIESQDNVEQIQELIKINVSTPRPLQLIDSLRKLRHNINYYGYTPTIADAEDAISFAKSCFEILRKTVFETIAKT